MFTKEENDDVWNAITVNMSGSWSPKLPPGNQDSFMDWMGAENDQARSISAKCECGVDITYKPSEESQYWHSFWCPKYKEKPKVNKNTEEDNK